ncbi:hypothetical protein DFJ74DRAFT_682988 [Hyaloraphidium curvatum]|nr:hypothetical protein DFJ74DRAFT_682988 [Hyaloraphidium curvatum]
MSDLAESWDRVEAAVGGAELLVVWRMEHSPAYEKLVRLARDRGIPVGYDLDDLVIDSSIVDTDHFDFVRQHPEALPAIKAMCDANLKAMLMADFGLASTQDLAVTMRRWNLTTFVVPNTFDRAFLEASDRANVDACRKDANDTLLRIGYASGTPTHQRDFRAAYPALRRVLRERPHARLVYFGANLDPAEFPGLEAQLEHRPAVNYSDLPYELCRFDVNIAPLQTGNPFTSSKSELKFFDAALAGVPTVASPVGPFVPAIRHAGNGFLAGDDGGWYDALDLLLSDARARRGAGRAARHSVLWRYSPERRARMLDLAFRSVLAGKRGDGMEARRLAEEQEGVVGEGPRMPPEMVGHEVVFEGKARGVPELAAVLMRTVTWEEADLPAGAAIEVVAVELPGTPFPSGVIAALNAGKCARVLHLRAAASDPTGLLDLAVHLSFAHLVYFPSPGRPLTQACLAAMLKAMQNTVAAFAVPGPACGVEGREAPAEPGAPFLLRKASWAAVAGDEGDMWAEMGARGMRGIAV